MTKKKIEAIYPLSPSQQGMLLETLQAPGSGLHMEQFTCAFHRPLDADAFRQAWQQIIARHAVFRTIFAWEKQEEPLQIVLQHLELPLRQQDWRSASASEQHARFATHLEAERQRGFDLSKPPLMRLDLFQLAHDRYLFAWTYHHILMDGWCWPLVLEEFFARYQAFAEGHAAGLAPTRSYQDYIVWLREQDSQEAERFWRQRLRGFTGPTPLGRADHTQTAVPGAGASYQEMVTTLSAEISTTLTALAQQYQVTLNTFIQGAWALILSRYSGHEDILFGITVSGRPPELTGIEATVGLFINTIPLRLQVPASAPFIEWLRRIHRQNLDQRPYEYYGQGQIHAWSEVPGAHSLYDSILVFQNYPFQASTSGSELAMDIRDTAAQGAHTRYALTLLVTPHDRMRVKAVYDGQWWAAEAVSHLLQHFVSTLARFCEADPERTLATFLDDIPDHEIPLVTPRFPQRLLNVFGHVPPRTSTEKSLAQIWSRLLGIERVGVFDDFFDLGGHSLLALQMVARAQEAGLSLTVGQLLKHPTIARLAAEMSVSQPIQAEQGPVTGPVPLTPGQHYFWEVVKPLQPHLYTTGLLLTAVERIDYAALQQAAHCLLAHHDTFRLQLAYAEQNGWQQTIAEPEAMMPCQRLDLTSVSALEREAAIKEAVYRLQTSFDLAAGPLFKVAWLDLGNEQPDHVLLMVNYQAADIMSWPSLLVDFHTAYGQIVKGEAVRLPAKTTSFKTWSERLVRLAQTPEVEQELGYWLSAAETPVARLPVDYSDGLNTVGSSETVSMTLTAVETQALLQACQDGMRAETLLLAALVESLASRTGRRALVVDMVSHGREPLFEDVDPSRTTGWFSTLYPLLLDVTGAPSPGASLTLIQEKIEGVPQGGLGFGLLRYLNKNEHIRAQLAQLPQAEVTFNMMGMPFKAVDKLSLFEPVTFVDSHFLDQEAKRPQKLGLFVSFTADNRLLINWLYSHNLYRQETIEQLTGQYKNTLKRFIASADRSQNP